MDNVNTQADNMDPEFDEEAAAGLSDEAYLASGAASDETAGSKA